MILFAFRASPKSHHECREGQLSKNKSSSNNWKQMGSTMSSIFQPSFHTNTSVPHFHASCLFDSIIYIGPNLKLVHLFFLSFGQCDGWVSVPFTQHRFSSTFFNGLILKLLHLGSLGIGQCDVWVSVPFTQRRYSSFCHLMSSFGLLRIPNPFKRFYNCL